MTGSSPRDIAACALDREISSISAASGTRRSSRSVAIEFDIFNPPFRGQPVDNAKDLRFVLVRELMAEKPGEAGIMHTQDIGYFPEVNAVFLSVGADILVRPHDF
jgi:hypothetical protein